MFDGASEGAIQLFENDILLISLKIDSKNKVKLLNDVEPIEIKDATLIESPLIFNNYDLLLRSQTLLDIGRKAMSRLGLPYTTLHTKDLFDKLCEPYYLPDLFQSDVDESLLQKLQDTISGYITYDRKERDFVFKREDRNIGIKNTASGIKTFGLLQILFVNQFIGKNSILIFDEPENHLHPKWQLKLAEILVELAKTGTYILIASHSPYMIEALQRYSEHSKHGAQARFYMAEGNEIIDRNRLDDIFHLLSEPFEEFRKIDSEILSNE